ncbi:MAG: class II fumarate hydratase [Phycisphaerales bacterium]
MPTTTRTESDTMGAMQVPADALYGASTARAVLNFPISGRGLPRDMVHAYALIKSAAAKTNAGLGLLDPARAQAIQDACRTIIESIADPAWLATHFPVDTFQTGSGTSTNMNANEVIANLVCKAKGKPLGSSKDPAYIESGGVHTNDHVNMGQSSNDTFPTAMHVAAAVAIKRDLIPALEKVAKSLADKATAWDTIVKIGRTHLQDATPIRLGQEFSGFAAQMAHAQNRLHRALHVLGGLALGGTAVGTGINTHKQFGQRVAAELMQATGVHFREAANHFEAQHAKDGYVEAHGILKTIAVSLSKVASDIRLMGCGPRCGIGELKIPAVQPGSSIMPGKVNPVICEAVMMVCCQVIGNDTTLTTASLGGIGGLLDLHVAMPVMAVAMLDSIHLLSRACHVMTDQMLAGLEPDKDRCAALIEGSLAMCTSLVPAIGYDKSAALAKQAYKEGKTVRQLAIEQGVLAKDQLDKLLDPWSMTKPAE